MKKTLLLTLLFAILRSGVAQKNTEHAAAVFMGRFETVVSTRSSFLLDSESRVHTHFINSENALRYPFLYWLAYLTYLDPRTPAAVEKSYATVMVGAHGFREPHTKEGLHMGLFHSRHVYVAVMDNQQTAPDLTQIFAKADYETVMDKRGWTWTIAPSESQLDPVTVHAQQAGPYLVLSNDKADFEAVLTALAAPGTGPPKEWNDLNAHPYWAYWNVDNRIPGQVMPGSDILSIKMATDLADGAKDGVFDVHVVSNDLTMANEPDILWGRRGEGKRLLKPGENGKWQGQVNFGMDRGNPALEHLMWSIGFGVES